MTEEQKNDRRWRYCLRYGFPARNQHDRPGWLMYADRTTGAPGGSGNTPTAAVDMAMSRTPGFL